MRLLQLLPSLLVVGAAWFPFTSGMAEFEQVRTKLAVDHSAADWDPAEKYFRESTAFQAPSLAYICLLLWGNVWDILADLILFIDEAK